MPRGIYDRSASRVRRLEDERDRLKRENEEFKKSRTVAGSLSGMEVLSSIDQHLVRMAEARHHLVDTDDINTDLVSRFDAEIGTGLQLAVTQRERVFGTVPRVQAGPPSPLPPAPPAPPFPMYTPAPTQPVPRSH